MCIIRFVILWLYFTLPYFTIQGQDNVFVFNQLALKDGLISQKFLYYIFQDSNHGIWISSVEGLNYYDGESFKAYYSHPEDSSQLLENTIHSPFFEDKHHHIWFSTPKAIHSFNPINEQFSRFYPVELDNSVQTELQLLFVDTVNIHLWVKNKDQFFIYSPQQDSILYQWDQLTMNYRSRAIAGKEKGEILVLTLTANKLLIYNLLNEKESNQSRNGKWNVSMITDSLTAFVIEAYDKIWISSTKEVYSVNPYNLSNRPGILRAEGAQQLRISHITHFNKDSLITMDERLGLRMLNKSTRCFGPEIKSLDQGLVQGVPRKIEQLYVDDDKNVWMSVPGRGLMIINPYKRKFRSYFQKQLSESSRHSSYQIDMLEDPNGRIISLTKTGINILNPSTTNFTGIQQERLIVDPLFTDRFEPFTIALAGKEKLWISSNKGTYVLDLNANTTKEILTEDKLRMPSMRIAPLPNGRILVLSLIKGIWELDTIAKCHSSV